MKIGVVLGTRPEIMKNYSLVRELTERGREHVVLHTNQHSDYRMQAAIFEQLGYRPDHVFPEAYRLGSAIDWVRAHIAEQGIDLVVVNGDTAAALVGALAAMYSDIGLAHVEAGMRSFDKQMYEERNRIMVDSVAHYLFSYTDYQAKYLAQIPDLRGKIFNVGNTTVDLLHDFESQLAPPPVGNYAYVTLHRKEFTDDPERMVQVLTTLNRLAERFDAIVFPLHPRTRAFLDRYGISPAVLSEVTVLDPVGPLESLAYVRHASMVITDSGCMQEEAYLFNVPCVTVRENTERPETVEAGANIVTGFAPAAIEAAVTRHAAAGAREFPSVYGESGVAVRVLDVLDQNFTSWSDY